MREIAIVSGGIILVATIIALFVLCTMKDRKKAYLSFGALILISGFTGIAEIAIAISPESLIDKIVPRVSDIIDENKQLTLNNTELKDDIKELKTQLKEEQIRYQEMTETVKNAASFQKYQLYLNGKSINANAEESIAKINDKLFFSQDILEQIVGEKLKEDKEKRVVYLGKYPEKYVDFLSVCEPFNISDGNAIEIGSEKPFKIRSRMYSEGLRLNADFYDTPRSVEFNLAGKYAELSFNVGHIDETFTKNKFYLKIYLDNSNEVHQTLEFDANVDIDYTYSIPLNYTKNLKMEWTCDDTEANYKASYGLINLRLK